MNILALSGSTRHASTNTALLGALAALAGPEIKMTLFCDLQKLPVFSPDLEGANTPKIIEDFARKIDQSDGIIISSPEYVHAIPGGLKNAIDWLVSRDEIIGKPVVLLHASHRGDDMLAALRLVLHTVSNRFDEKLFLRFPLVSMSPEEVSTFMQAPESAEKLSNFLAEFGAVIRAGQTGPNRS